MEQHNTEKSLRKNLWYVGIFAVAMAYLESAVVVYLRRVYNITDLTISLSRFDPQISAIELGRELATLIMLLAVGWAAGKNFQSRFGFTVFAFGLWDIFYYFWLRVFIGWPVSFLNPDLLFLIPLPWWGPVLAPVLIAALMVVGGMRAILLAEKGVRVWFKPVEWVALIGGVFILLYTFMADALSLLPTTVETLAQMKPTTFNWPLYLVGFVLALCVVWRATGHKKNK